MKSRVLDYGVAVCGSFSPQTVYTFQIQMLFCFSLTEKYRKKVRPSKAEQMEAEKIPSFAALI